MPLTSAGFEKRVSREREVTRAAPHGLTAVLLLATACLPRPWPPPARSARDTRGISVDKDAFSADALPQGPQELFDLGLLKHCMPQKPRALEFKFLRNWVPGDFENEPLPISGPLLLANR